MYKISQKIEQFVNVQLETPNCGAKFLLLLFEVEWLRGKKKKGASEIEFS